MIDVAEHQARRRPMNDQPDIAADADRPEVRIPRLGEPVKLHRWVRRIKLEIERRRLHSLLLLASQPGEAIGKGVGDSEVHSKRQPPIGLSWLPVHLYEWLSTAWIEPFERG